MDTFELKYFSESRLLAISKKIQRERKKRLEEIEWQKFCQKNTAQHTQHQQEPNKPITSYPIDPAPELPQQRTPFVEQIPIKPDYNIKISNEPPTRTDEIIQIETELPLPERNACNCKMLSPISEETIKEIIAQPRTIECELNEDGCDVVLSPIRTLNSGVSSVNFKKIDLHKLEEESALVHFTTNINQDDQLISGRNSLVETKFTDDLYSIQESNLPTTERRTDDRKNYVLGHLERVVVYQYKMDLHLDKISFLFDKIPKPFDMADKNRRELRAAGFATLFSRNNIYPLERKVTDIEKMLTNDNGLPTAQGTSRSLSKKLVEAHHLAARSLGAYLSHMPTSVLTGVPEKLQKLLELIVELANLCDQLQVTETGADIVRQIMFGDDLNRSKCQQLLVKVQNQMASIRRNELMSAEKVRNSYATSQPSPVPRRGQKGFRNKKSPYEMAPFAPTGTFKKSFDALARARFGPPSKPKETKPNKLISKKKPSSAGGKKNSTKPALARKSSAGTIRDDPSETYVAQFPITQNELRTAQTYMSPAHEMEMGDATLVIGKQLRDDVISKKLLPKLADYLEKNKEIALSVQELARYFKDHMTADENTSTQTSRNLDRKSAHVIAKDKNAQLIILPEYEGSEVPEIKVQQLPVDVATLKQTELDDSVACSFDKNEPRLNIIEETAVTAERKTADLEKQATGALHFNTPVTPRSSASYDQQTTNKGSGYEPLTVSASSVNRVTKYAEEYKEFIRKIPVYRPTLQPWKVISRISNHFVDEALRDIIKELDFDYLVTMMYKLEFE